MDFHTGRDEPPTRPSQVDSSDERASSRDIVLCLDVSGSTLPYDREAEAALLRTLTAPDLLNLPTLEREGQRTRVLDHIPAR